MSELLFEYKVRTRHRLGWKEFSFYATTDIEEFLNRNSIDYVRNITDTIEHRQLKEIERLNNVINEFDKWLDINLFNLEKEKANNIYDKGLKQGMLSNGRLIKNKLQELKDSDKE